MSWDEKTTGRESSRRYYYRYDRDRRGKVYVGRGLAGRTAAGNDARARVAKQKHTAEWNEMQVELKRAIAPLRKLCGNAKLMLHVTLLLAGFHRHDRGAWRLRRVPHAN